MTGNDLLEGINGEFSRLTEDELANFGIVLGAYRSFRGDRRAHVAYVGMPITTGKRFVDVLREHGVKTREELARQAGPQALWELVIKPNIEEGIAFADSLGQRHNLLFIAPSVFEAKKWRWSQDAYMSLWYRVIGELSGRHYVMQGWQYSVGGVKEVLFSMLMQWGIIRPFTAEVASETFGLKNFHPGLSWDQLVKEYEGMRRIRVFDHKGQEITLVIALRLVVEAIQSLKAWYLPFADLIEPAGKLKALWAFSPVFMAGTGWPYYIDQSEYWELGRRLERLMVDTN